MDRDEIVRGDFPATLRGWDPDAVREHLERIAREVEKHATPLAETASRRVAAIVEAAERQAAEIEAEARARAEGIVAAARTDADQILESGREKARRQSDDAHAAIADLVAQAERLRERIASAPVAPPATGAATGAEVEPGPVIVPEPEPPLEPEPGPTPVPEPEPPLEPEPEPPDIPEPSPEPPPPPPGPEEPPQPVAGERPSTEELIARLKAPGTGAAGTHGAAPDAADAARAADDKAAARLVAMKMALEGASREEIDRHLADNYSLASREKLLDDVLARAKA
jgi:hypothetical protein